MSDAIRARAQALFDASCLAVPSPPVAANMSVDAGGEPGEPGMEVEPRDCEPDYMDGNIKNMTFWAGVWF